MKLTYLLIAYLLITSISGFYLIFFEKAYSFWAKRSSVKSTRHTGHMTLYDFSTRQHIFHWTKSVTVEQPRPHSGLLQDVGCHLAASLSFNVNDLKQRS